MPIADKNQHEKKNGDHQQPSSLRRIHRMPVLLLSVIVRRGGRHANIVAPGPKLFLRKRCALCAYALRSNPRNPRSSAGRKSCLRMLN